MSFLTWLLPMGDFRTPLGLIWKIALSRSPAKLLSNIIGALVLTGYMSIAFYRRKSKREKDDGIGDVRGGESLA